MAFATKRTIILAFFVQNKIHPSPEVPITMFHYVVVKSLPVVSRLLWTVRDNHVLLFCSGKGTRKSDLLAMIFDFLRSPTAS